jgi:hypothetical protein
VTTAGSMNLKETHRTGMEGIARGGSSQCASIFYTSLNMKIVISW